MLETGRPARIDDYADASGRGAEFARRWSLGASVGVPVSVAGRLWGYIVVGSTQAEPLPAGTEARLAGFTELVTTAIANAEAQAALTASRARIVATADATRRRIERDLHDGAQQRLVSLALQLRAAQAAVPPGTGELVQQLDDMADVLDELREIARGIHPAVLAEGGLRPALRTLARRSAIPIDLTVQAERRLPEPIEIAAYYVVSEALTNVAKHAHASVAEVEVAVGDGVLHVRVRDDGRGGADFGHGSGLVGLKDRVEALGGRLSVQSSPPQALACRPNSRSAGPARSPADRGAALPRPGNCPAGTDSDGGKCSSAAPRTASSPPLYRAFDAGLRPGPFPVRAASLLPGLLAATRTGLPPAGDDELMNTKKHHGSTSRCHLPLCWAHESPRLVSPAGTGASKRRGTTRPRLSAQANPPGG